MFGPPARFSRQRAFEDFDAGFIQPLPDIESDAQIDEFVRRTCETVYHPSSTTKMGRADDKMAVVDAECRVLGMDGLRVVDASIMPSITSGNLNAPVTMMAEKAADIILGKPPLPREKVPVYKH